MIEINKGEPSAYDLVFPVFAGKLDANGAFDPHEIYGTAFYIGNNVFVTCAHTIQSAAEHEVTVLGFKTENNTLAFATVHDTEVFESNDSGLLVAVIDRAKSYPWLQQKLAMLNRVISVGYPYGLNKHRAEVYVRGFGGHIVSVGFNENFEESPDYELSFQVPRGLSGGPLFYVTPQQQYVCGMVIGNEMTDMIVHSFEEKEENPKGITRYVKTEAFHIGIAVQTSSFLDKQSRILGCTIGEYLGRAGLLT